MDTFAEDRILNDLRENGILKFNNAGAYCFSMASNYNSGPKPAEILVLNGKDYLIRKREAVEDIMNNQTEVDIKINHRNNSGL